VDEEVGQAARPSAEVECAERPRDRPPHSDRGRNDVVESLLAHDSLRDEVHGLTEERGLQPVGDEAWDLAAEHLRALADGRVERDRQVDDGRVGGLRRRNLDERHEVRRVERMPDNQASRRLHALRRL
jgi:hypothetical protein